MRVEITALAKRLTPTATGALERAAKHAASEAHHEVTIDHVLLQILSVGGEDAQELLSAAGADRDEAKIATRIRLSTLRDGNGGRPGFAKELWPWIEGAWLLASTELAEHRLRTGALLWAAARHAAELDHAAGPLAKLADMKAEAVHAALAKSPESTEAFDLAELEKLGKEVRAEHEAVVRGEIEREREEEAKAVAEAKAQAIADAKADAAAKASAMAQAAAKQAAAAAWAAADAAQKAAEAEAAVAEAEAEADTDSEPD